MDLINTKQTRKSAIKSMFSAIAAAGAGLFGLSAARSSAVAATRRLEEAPVKLPDLHWDDQNQTPLFSGVTVHKGLVFVAGKGEHGEGDIRVHTEKVLDKIEAELNRVGSSMDKALLVTVYLHNLRDYAGMNEAYRGRFGNNPPARTTVAVYGGVPGNSLVEMDCIAAL